MKKIFAFLLCSSLFFNTISAQYGLKSTCTANTEYHFTGSMVMKSTVSGITDEPMEMKMNMYFADSGRQTAMIMENDMTKGMDMKMITNFQDSTMVLLMDMGGMKKGSCMKMADAQKLTKNKEVPNFASDWAKYKKSGNTKTIMGHICEEFVFEDEKIKQVFWITQDLAEWSDMFTRGYQGFNDGKSALPAGMKGTWLGFEQIMKEDNQIVIGEMVELNINKKFNISTEGYDFD